MTRGTLLVLDGWGTAPAAPDNAITAARTPALDRLLTQCPSTLLRASGTDVGLPAGVVGNSEIGHLVIGAGRALEYDSLLVQRAVEKQALRGDPRLRACCERLRATGRALHLVALCSTGRIHSDLDHIGELLHSVAANGAPRVWLHAITDGRDVPNGTAGQFLAALAGQARSAGVGSFATVIGRNYAMDKSGRAELTDAASRLIVDGVAETTVPSGPDAATGTTDDGWLAPTLVAGSPGGVVDGDGVLFANFRSDRTAPLVTAIHRQLTESGRVVDWLSLTQYDCTPAPSALVARADASGGLADTLENHGLRSVRIAEPEKFEHVTFFVNGRDPRRRDTEEWVPVPSNAGGDYVGSPQMNVAGVADAVIDAGARDEVALVLANLANIDVVGHTGDYPATVRATEEVDRAVARILAAAAETGRWVALVGDHGNGEQMSRADQDDPARPARPYGGHTTNPVPFVLCHPAGVTLGRTAEAHQYGLASVAPTVLRLLGAHVPAAMTGSGLLAPEPVPSRLDR